MKYLVWFIFGFVVAVLAEGYLPHTKFQLGCYKDGSRTFRTDAWIHQDTDPVHVYYPVGSTVTVLHSYQMWLSWTTKYVECDEMKDGNKQ